jgi:uncharacterized Tic20 family protein
VFVALDAPLPIALGVGGVAAGALLGATVGLMQWLALRRQVSWVGRWVLACTAGGVVALVVGGLVSLALGEVLALLMIGPVYFAFAVGIAVYGAAAGTMQWLILRRHVSRTGWWVLASIVAGLTGRGLGRAVAVGVSLALLDSELDANAAVMPGAVVDAVSTGRMTSQGVKMEEQGSKTQLERVLAALAHGSILLWVPLNIVGGGIIFGRAFVGIGIGIAVALSIWLVMKGRSAYVRGQALQAVVYQVAVVVVTAVGSIVWLVLCVMTWMDFVGGGGPAWAEATLFAFLVGLPVLAILYALWGAVRCLGGHDFRYPIVSKLVGWWI